MSKKKKEIHGIHSGEKPYLGKSNSMFRKHAILKQKV